MESGRRFDSVWTWIALTEVAVAIATLQVEKGLGLPRLMPLVVVGFAIHSWLPLQRRIAFFLGLGLLGAVLLFGPLGAVALLVGVLVFLGACHLPVSHAVRVGVVVLLGAGVAWFRSDWMGSGPLSRAVPILASMLMFRLIIYLYDIRHERKPVPFGKRLAYFFLLPNLIFPLFPVVDYQRFVRSHYAREADAIHRRGVSWMLLGAVQILVYRAIYLYVLPEADSIRDAVDVALYAATAYLQYLRISGMFHVAVGILCVFGFDLPPTNRWYFFSADFADLWRRANSYWKDFLQKVVYFPVFMRYRKAGMTRSVVLATIAVFATSWALHVWQWFWLRGEVVFTDVDVAFWGLVGATVVVASVRASGEPPEPVVRTPLVEAVVLTRNIAVIFVTSCVLWSLWASASLAQWFAIVAQARNLTPGVAAGFVAVGAGLFTLGVGVAWLQGQGRLPDLDAALQTRPVLVAGATALMVIGLTSTRVPPSQALAWTVEPGGVSLGYYEALLQSREGMGLGVDDELFEPTNDLRRFRLKTSAPCSRQELAPCQTNEYGMRDGSVSREPAPGVMRIAWLGSSPEQGYGLGDGFEYPAVLDERLGPTVEVLNFGVLAYGPVQQVGALEPALDFEPDLVVFVTHCKGETRATRGLLIDFMKAYAEGHPFPPELEAYRPPPFDGPENRRAWIDAQVPSLTQWAYKRIAERSRAEGAVPIWIYMPLPAHGMPCEQEMAAIGERWAREAGFETLRLSADEMFEDRWWTELIGDPAGHPNAAGSEVIADHLVERLKPWIEQRRANEAP